MSQSRKSSPINGSTSNSPLQLTPNSKVKALLASLDNDSDDSSDSASALTRLRNEFAKKATSKPKELPKDVECPTEAQAPQNLTQGKDDEEDDEEEIVRPKGRMAARMLHTDVVSEDDGEQNIRDAQERVKKTMSSKSPTLELRVHKNVEESDEDVAPIVPRKRKIRTARHSTPTSTRASPGLFVSPTRISPTPQTDDSDSEDLALPPANDDRFKALVERAREARKAKEAEEAAKKAKLLAERKKVAETYYSEEDNTDDQLEKKLTQSQRPSRKASKRAVEEIQRETQRMSRNMQLTHKAVTKKQFKKVGLFAKFNYKTADVKEEETQTSQLPDPVQQTSSSSITQSDVEMHETPPTSPASQPDDTDKINADVTTQMPLNEIEKPRADDNDDDLPTLEEIRDSTFLTALDKGKGKGIDEPTPEPKISSKKYSFTRRPVIIHRSETVDDAKDDSSDNDLEIVDAKIPDAKRKKLDAIFDRIPAKQAKEPHSLQALKMLAHLTSPGKQNLGRNTKPSITNSEMQMSLQRRAKQQAAREREERLNILREKGVIIPTAEERERDRAEVENMLERARREGEEIKQREKAADKKERKANGEPDPLGDSSDDEDWEEEKENFAEELAGSGLEDGADESELDDSDESGDEADDEGADGPVEEGLAMTKSMFDNEADETDDGEDEEVQAEDEPMLDVNDAEEDEEDSLPVKQVNRRVRKSNVISDDEEEDTPVMETPVAPRTESPRQTHADSPIAPNSVLRSATKTFIPGVTVAGPAGLGLTQIFAGTMDESQVDASPFDSVTPVMERKTDSMGFFKQFTVPELPPFVPTMPSMEEDSQDIVMDSQSANIHNYESQAMDFQTQAIDLDFTQSQMHGFDSLVEPIATQLSEYPDATQDVGFQHMTPIKGRFTEAPASTIDTVVLGPSTVPDSTIETPIVKKKGKLRQKIQVALFSDEEDMDEPDAEYAIQDRNLDTTENIFDEMRKASKKRLVIDEFDKKTSEAKTMVNEQAEESEDEYAGLGGASDDESGGEADEYVKEMIDDAAGNNADGSKLAAFFADRERANDEKQVEKLYNDISKGMLRRRRGADYDLSDSDDGGEARRRMKQKKFAKMQKALLADEKIGKIAENPKRQAFLRAIEDRGSEDEMDFLGDFAEQEDAVDSQSQSQAEDSQQRVPDSQPDVIMGPPKRKRSDDTAEAEMRPPPNLRRPVPAKKPTNLSEIRESLSSLIEEPNQMLAPPQSDSESDEELEIEGKPETQTRRPKEKENRDPFALRRTSIQTVDRIALKRASSSGLSANTRLAFSTGSTGPGVKVPPLLRRATTNSSITSVSSSSSSVTGGMSATERMAGAGGDGIKRGGGKHSGVNYFARETERKAAVMKTEKRREQKRFKGAESRRKVVGGLFGGGKFE